MPMDGEQPVGLLVTAGQQPLLHGPKQGEAGPCEPVTRWPEIRQINAAQSLTPGAGVTEKTRRHHHGQQQGRSLALVTWSWLAACSACGCPLPCLHEPPSGSGQLGLLSEACPPQAAQVTAPPLTSHADPPVLPAAEAELAPQLRILDDQQVRGLACCWPSCCRCG